MREYAIAFAFGLSYLDELRTRGSAIRALPALTTIPATVSMEEL